MSEESGSLVECSVCGTEFDPNAAGGWCTNPDCGEWKYEGDDAPAPAAVGDDQEVNPEGDDPLADPSETDTTEYTAAEIVGEPETDQPTDASSRKSDPLADDDPSEAEETKEPSAVKADEEPARANEEASSEDDQSESEDQTAGIVCPGCGDTLDSDANFCPSCGEDISALDPDDGGELTACPACGDSVDAEDSFCASCGENLDSHRESTPLTVCPECGVTVSEDDRFCTECGENLDAHRESSDTDDATPAESTADETDESADDQSAPDSLLLRTRGQEIVVSDGEIVGRELRKIITETGGDENDAVRIHREHIRFVREEGVFHLVDLGENPTEVNGRSLAKGDREPIAPGDTITLSDVVTLAVARQ